MRSALSAFALATLCSTPLPAAAALLELTSLFVFGDSLADGGNSGLRSQQFTGNPNVVFPPPPYAKGRFSNGPTAVEYLWNSYNPGNPGFQPSLAGGTNYAIGGATTGSANFNEVNPSVPFFLKPGAYAEFGNAWQLQQHLASAPVFDPATSLFVVWLFPNDVLADAVGLPPGVVPGSPGGPNVVANGIANILATIGLLADAGAQHFLIPNMPDLGKTPGFPNDSGLSALTAAFNLALKFELTELDKSLSAEIVQFDTAAAFAAIRKDPAAYGFTNTTEACTENLANGRCNPDTWLFWDSLHPTTAAHELLGAQFRAAVPEPSSVALLAAALLALGWFRRAART